MDILETTEKDSCKFVLVQTPYKRLRSTHVLRVYAMKKETVFKHVKQKDIKLIASCFTSDEVPEFHKLRILSLKYFMSFQTDNCY